MNYADVVGSLQSAVMDEAYGRTVAEVEAIQTGGTDYLVLSLVRDGEHSTGDAEETLDEMLDAGWYCQPDLYAKLLTKLGELG